MRPLLVATTNPGKLLEIRSFFVGSDITILSLNDFPQYIEPEETGATFEDNALLKAKSYFEQCGIPALADDGGIEIDALGGEPGVRTRRWIGREMTDVELIDYTLLRLQGIPFPKRTARFRVVLTFFDGINMLTDTDYSNGIIVTSRPAIFTPGYPFRAIFFLPQFGKIYDDLTPAEHESVNHRLKALHRMKPRIEERLR